MPDPVDPTPPPTANPTPGPGAGSTTTSTGLPANVAAALACIPLIGGLIFYILEKQDRFVRFYAMQSIIFGGICFLFWIIANIIGAILWRLPVVGAIFAPLWWFLSGVIDLGLLVIMIIAMVKAFTGVQWDIPFVGPIARKQLGETV
jgi:uncharacterized membrane protein